MESGNLNSPPPEDDPLDALLRQSRPAPVADEGFSARVVSALRIRPKLIAGWRPFEWLVAALALGLCLVIGPHLGSSPFNQPGSQLGMQVVAWLDALLDSKAVTALAVTLGTLALISFDEELPPESSL
jgi:hypothetical protein